MKHTFDFVYPDGPYEDKVTSGLTAKITYDGPRYIMVEIQEDGSMTLAGVDKTVERLEEASERMNPDLERHIIDVKEQPAEVCYLTGTYSHDPVPDYVEELPDGQEFRHEWGDAKIINDVASFGGLEWDKKKKKIKPLEFKKHNLTTEQVIETFKTMADEIEAVLNDPIEEVPADEEAVLRDHIVWLRDWGTTYAGFDHWKVPFPVDLPIWQDYAKD